MRWENFFSGYQSLWDSEIDNAELDERRELIRAERAQIPFIRLLAIRGEQSPLDVLLSSSREPVHVGRVGASWVEGNFCGTSTVVVAPLHSVNAMLDQGSCTCSRTFARSFPHVTIGARLRACERENQSVTVTVVRGGFRGRLVAVWKDAVDVQVNQRPVSIPISSIEFIVLERP